MSERKHKEKLLAEFVERHSHLPKQGSEQWLFDRTFTIGGSEIATVIGKNKYSNLSNLVALKTKIISFRGNIATRWGRIMEKSTDLFVSSIFKCGHIYELGSIPHSTIDVHKYSPDGLCLMKINKKYYIVLLEFKAPYCSIPDGQIPPHYLPQVKAGLCTIDIADMAIFVNNVYRKCSMRQLRFDDTYGYDSFFHSNDERKDIVFQEPIAIGIILFHIEDIEKATMVIKTLLEDQQDHSDFIDSDADSDSDSGSDSYSSSGYNSENEFSAGTESDSDYDLDESIPYISAKTAAISIEKHILSNMNNANPRLLDLGTVSYHEMNRFTEYVAADSTSFIRTKHIRPNFNKTHGFGEELFVSPELNAVFPEQDVNFVKTMRNYINICKRKGRVPVAVMPWKLYKSDVILQQKDPHYLSIHEPKMRDVITQIKRIRHDDMDTTVRNYEKEFGRIAVVKNYWSGKSEKNNEPV